MKRKVILGGILLLLLSIGFYLFFVQKNRNTHKSQIEWLDYPESLASLLDQFKGKVVYIDMMASWCRPCIEELKKYEETEDFFVQNDIIKLFISLEEQNGWANCIQLLDNNGLKGYFVTMNSPKEMENTKFREEIMQLIVSFDENGNVGEFSIPQYFIVDKNGNIIDHKVPRPSQPKALIEQLKKYTN